MKTLAYRQDSLAKYQMGFMLSMLLTRVKICLGIASGLVYAVNVPEIVPNIMITTRLIFHNNV